ncbi:MAG TPA: biotin/lipoyl-binding protein, partial [Anaerolineales bacterium]
MKNRRIPVIIVVLVVILVAGYYGLRSMASGSNNGLKASGTIEATTVNVSPELAGKVASVLVEEGQAVQAGQVLFRLDDTLLQAQHEAAMAGLQAAQTAAQTAQAAYGSAQAQYSLAETAARAQARPTRLGDWTGKTPNYFDQPRWYFTQAEQITAGQAEVQAAEQGVSRAENHLASVVGAVQNADFVAAEQRLSNARLSYEVARQVQAEGQAVGAGLSPDQLPSLNVPALYPGGYRVRVAVAQNLPSSAELANAAQAEYDAASQELSAAQAAYDGLLSTQAAQAVLEARAELAVAHEREQVAQDRLSSLQTGEASPQVAV